jgi:hypothetical protein
LVAAKLWAATKGPTGVCDAATLDVDEEEDLSLIGTFRILLLTGTSVMIGPGSVEMEVGAWERMDSSLPSMNLCGCWRTLLVPVGRMEEGKTVERVLFNKSSSEDEVSTSTATILFDVLELEAAAELSWALLNGSGFFPDSVYLSDWKFSC